MEKLTILLTGGTGFIGKNIQEKLADKYRIFAPGHRELDLTNAEAVYNFLQNNPVDVVINAAAVGVGRNSKFDKSLISTNLRIFFNLVRAKNFYTRMIMLGSGAENDKTRPLIKVKEEEFDQRVPADEYGFYKYICAKYAEKSNFITHLRLFGVFGKYEDYETRFISNIICMALFDLPIKMKGNAKFAYLFVDDFIRILDRILQNPPKDNILNIASGNAVDLESIAKKVLAKLDKNLAISKENDDMGKEYSADISKQNEYLGQEFEFTPLEEALDNLINYYKSIIMTLNKDKFLIVN